MTDHQRKAAIRDVLLERAAHGQTIFYAELGEAVGMSAHGPWKPILDEISREETSKGLPDITFLVINKQTRLPGQIGFKPAKPPSSEQRAEAAKVMQDVFNHYRRP